MLRLLVRLPEHLGLEHLEVVGDRRGQVDRDAAKTAKSNTTILHSKQDDVIPFQDSLDLVQNSGLPSTALVEVGSDHRLADEESLGKMLEACEMVQGTI